MKRFVTCLLAITFCPVFLTSLSGCGGEEKFTTPAEFAAPPASAPKPGNAENTGRIEKPSAEGL